MNMKTYQKLFFIKAICLSMFFGIMFTSCRSNEPVSPLEEVHQKMLGQWEAVHWPDWGKQWTFTADSMIGTQHKEGDTIQWFTLTYKLIDDSTIYLCRLWEDQNEPYHEGITDFHFEDDSTLFINEVVGTISLRYPPQHVPITFKRKK